MSPSAPGRRRGPSATHVSAEHLAQNQLWVSKPGLILYPLCAQCHAHVYQFGSESNLTERAVAISTWSNIDPVLVSKALNGSLMCTDFSGLASAYGFPQFLSLAGFHGDAFQAHTAGQWAMAMAMHKGIDLHAFVHHVIALPFVHSIGLAGVVHGMLWYAVSTANSSHLFNVFSSKVCVGFVAMQLYDCYHGVGHGSLLWVLNISRSNFHQIKPCSPTHIPLVTPITVDEFRRCMELCHGFQRSWQQHFCAGGVFHGQHETVYHPELELETAPPNKTLLWPCDLLDDGAEACLLWRLLRFVSYRPDLWDARTVCHGRRHTRRWTVGCVVVVSTALFLQFDAFMHQYYAHGKTLLHMNPCCVNDLELIEYNGFMNHVFPVWNWSFRPSEKSLDVLSLWCSSITMFHSRQFDEELWYACIKGSMSVPGTLMFHDGGMAVPVRQLCGQVDGSFLSPEQRQHSFAICWSRAQAVQHMLSGTGNPVSHWY